MGKFEELAREDEVVAAFPATGWWAYFQEDDESWVEPVLGWVVLRNGVVRGVASPKDQEDTADPMDSDGFVEYRREGNGPRLVGPEQAFDIGPSGRRKE